MVLWSVGVIVKLYGNVVYLGVVLLDADLKQDALITDFACPPVRLTIAYV